MKSFTLLTLVAAVSASTNANKASMKKRLVVENEVQIDSFEADCIPHGTQCLYSFNVNSVPGLPGSNCTLMADASAQNGVDYLPDVIAGSCADNDAWTWMAKRQQDGGIWFGILYFDTDSQTNLTSCHTIQTQDLSITSDGATSSEHYVGSSNFSASLAECVGPNPPLPIS